MSDKKNSKKSARPWWLLPVIWLLFVVVAGLNIGAALVYAREKTLVNYFDSKCFEGLLIALLIPLLLTLIAEIFKIGEKIEAEQKQRAQKLEEAELLAKEIVRKRQTDTIEKTNAMWSELYRLSTEVAYFKVGQNKTALREIRRRLECFANSAEEVVNLWHLNFSDRNVSQEVGDFTLSGLNLLLLSAATVADVIEDASDPASELDAKKLQNCLLVIQDGVRTALHYPLMQVFYFAMEGQTAELENKIANLGVWGGIFRDLMQDQHPNLPPDPATKNVNQKRDAYQSDYQKKCAQAKTELNRLRSEAAALTDRDKQNELINSPKYQAAEKAFDQAENDTKPALNEYYQAVTGYPANLLGLSRKRILPDDEIVRFTREMFFYSEQISIKDRS